MSNKFDEQKLKSIESYIKNPVAYDEKKEKLNNYETNIKEMPHYGIRRSKIVPLEEAIKNCGIKNGMTLSFHHHFRTGDKTMLLVLSAIKKMGIKDLKIAASSLTSAHNFLSEYIEDGVVTSLETSGCRDHLGEFISSGKCKIPVIFRSHGGRARAVGDGEVKIDIAFIAASSSDDMGNSNGTIGKSRCGSLGYGIWDAQNAKHTVIITDTIVDFPNQDISISQVYVDYVVSVDEIGDSKGIMSGEIRLTSNPKEEIIAKNISDVVTNTSLFKNSFSLQMGTGGASLSAVKSIRKEMVTQNIKAGFCLGGITSHQVKLLEDNMVDALFDTQCFDLGAVDSIAKNKRHHEINASEYANLQNKSAFVNKLDYVILSALEVDTNFNVNVLVGSDGVVRGAIGGHQDTAHGAKISIVALPLIRGRMSCVVDNVQSIITPGATVDVIVTDLGIAVNPLRKDLIDELTTAKIKLITLEDMKKFAYEIVGKPQKIEFDYSKPVGIIEWRDGSILDIIYKVKN